MAHSNRIRYEVTATLRDAATAARWLEWMRGEHLDEVLAAGAERAELAAVEAEPGASFVVSYEFASRGAFEQYLREHAPRLRAKGAARFPPEQVSYQRRWGLVLIERERAG